MNHRWKNIVVWIYPVLLAGCGGSSTPGHASGGHHHPPPHGGAGVVLGKEDFHIEFLHNPDSDTMTAWFFTPHMEDYLRIKTDSFDVVAKLPDGEQILTFKAVANPATGETVGDTSQFEVRSGWLKNAEHFDAVLKKILIRTNLYEGVSFNYPNGD